MTIPRVFASYAQRDHDKVLRKFIDELAKELDRQTVGDAATVVFFDRKDVHAGEKWSDVIIEALSEAGVLLCLMTPRYFTRPWCGRELQTFVERTSKLPGAAKPHFIFPVWWLRPAVPRPIPKRLAEYLNTDGEFPPEYEAMGLRDLALAGKRAKFERTARRLAVLMTRALASPPQLPPAKIVSDVFDIMNAFDEQQPNDIRVVSLTQGGDAWRPSAGEPTIAEALDATSESRTVFIRKADTGPGLIQSLLTAQAEQQIILLIVDIAQPVDATLTAINALAELENLALLLIDVGNPSVGADAWLGKFTSGAFAKARAEGRFGIATVGSLLKEMDRTVFRARTVVMGRTEPASVQDDRLADLAREQGISVAAQPNLTGPATK
jgi:hypothetical protein